jgi:hypothetical protein
MTDSIHDVHGQLYLKHLDALARIRELEAERADLLRQRQDAIDSLESMRDSLQEQIRPREIEYDYNRGVLDTLRMVVHVATEMLTQPEFWEIERDA